MTMLTRSQLLSLTTSLRNQPVLSVYIDGRATDPYSRQWRIELDHAIDGARRRAKLDHEGQRNFDLAVSLLFERLGGQTAGLGAAGWVGFIGPHEVHYANTTTVSMPTVVVWDRGAHVGPYVRAAFSSRDSVLALALVDARKVDIFEYRDGRLSVVEEIRAHHVNGHSGRLGGSPREGFHAGTRGGTGRDRLQRALREGTARMERAAADAIRRRAGEAGFIFVAGTPQHRRELHKRLAAEVAPRLLELETVPAQLALAMEAGCSLLRRRRLEREVMAVIEAAGARGPAAVGPETTRWALDQGRVQALFLTPRFLDEHATEAEEAVRSALAQHAEIDVVGNSGADQLDARGGVAARLRYRLV